MAYIDEKPRKQVPHFSIFDYWKDKAILENGEIVEIKDKPIGNYERVIYDWGEPCCWACDKPVMSTFEHDNIPEVDLSKIWNDVKIKKHLDRCHIVPRTKGGEDSPSNMFLMCKSCHEKSPDTVNTRAFFRWVYDQRKTHAFGISKFDVIYEKVQKAMSRRGLNICPEDMVKVCDKENLSYENLKEYLSSHIETHGLKYSETSILEGFVDWLIHNYVEACLEVAV